MFKNYIKTAIRSLLRHKFFSAINVFGLAVAMSISMGIIMIVADQETYDRYNTKRNRIYRVITSPVDHAGNETGGQRNAASTMALRDELMDKYTGVAKAVRLKRGFGNNWLEFEGEQDVNVPLSGFYADPEVFDFFEYEFQYGDPATALRDPYTVVLSRRAADKLFEPENPVGLTIKVGELGTFTVTGVLKETEQKTHIAFEALASMATVSSPALKAQHRQQRSVSENWTDFSSGWTYILLEPGKSPIDVQNDLDNIYLDHIAVIKDPGTAKMKFKLQALEDVTPDPMLNNPIGPAMPWSIIYFLAGLALLILLTSCFNFTNLSIARSLTRAREIGVRKVAGAKRWQIFLQFLTESIVVSYAALAIAVVLLLIVKPMILQLNFARLFHWDMESNIIVYSIFIVFAFIVGIMAGLFPAIVLSAFQPVKVLKNLNSLKVFSRVGLRKVLLVVQFTLSLFFILSAIIMHDQLSLFMSKDHGFNMQSNIMIKLNKTAPGLLKTELLKFSNIENVTAVSHVAAGGINTSTGFKKSLTEDEWTPMDYFSTDEDYLKNMELQLVAGEFFNPAQAKSNESFIVINEEAVKKLHYNSPDDAVGETIISQSDSLEKVIIGVVKDYNHRDLTSSITPMALVYDPAQFGMLQVRYSGNYDDAISAIGKSWAYVNSGFKSDIKSLETEIKQMYKIVFGDLVNVLGIIAFLAITISCLGLLGMATYTTETRLKEISIRKVLGSSSSALVILLSKGFLVVLGIATAVGIPIAYFVNNIWLELLAYRTTLSPLVVLEGVAILALFAMLTIGSQTIRATFVKPVDNLRIE